jgi:uncharacterized protein (TIGR00730 family)
MATPDERPEGTDAAPRQDAVAGGPPPPLPGPADAELAPRSGTGPSGRDADAWDAQRILGEFVDGFAAMARIGRAVSIFGSARTPPGHPDYEHARVVGERFARAGFAVITGGGPGIMEAANRGARDGGGLSVGCTIELQGSEQIPNAYLDLTIDFHSFFARKTMFVRYAEAFVVFPGGLGTLDELFEAATLVQTGKIRRFPIILVGSARWRPMIDWLREDAVADARLTTAELGLLQVLDDPDEIVRTVAASADRRS